MVGEGSEDRVLECGVLAAVLAVSSSSACTRQQQVCNHKGPPHHIARGPPHHIALKLHFIHGKLLVNGTL